jgi:hypothetical protein
LLGKKLKKYKIIKIFKILKLLNCSALCRECSPNVQEWWAKYLEEVPLPPSIVPKMMKDNLWLEQYFADTIHDEILDTKVCNPIFTFRLPSQTYYEIIQVVGEHPKYFFSKMKL